MSSWTIYWPKFKQIWQELLRINKCVEHFSKALLRFSQTWNSKVQKPPSQLRLSLPSIIITIISNVNEPWNTETHKTDRNPPITNHKPWPFEPVKVKFCFLRGPLRLLTAAKNALIRQLAFKLQNSHVCEKRRNIYFCASVSWPLSCMSF